MNHVLSRLLVAVGLGGAILSQGAALVQAQAPHAALIEIDDTIHAVSARFLDRGIDTATEDGATLLIVVLDTPGGLLSSTRDMVGSIQASGIPVVVYVAPSGARAASAGTFITAAAHVAAMAPVTNIGAASPVGRGGDDLPETLEKKATQDAAAFMREIAEARGRNADALAETVLKATAFSATEASENNMVDLIATDVDDLLRQLDGRTVEIGGATVVLQTAGLEVRAIRRTPVERFLGIIADPDIAFLLFTIGSLGLVFELMAPGLIVPGIVGVITLALAFLAFGNLPVNWAGVALLVFAIVLFFLELQAPGIGVFGIAGAFSFLLGAFLLFGGLGAPAIETPSVRVSLWVIAVAAAVMFASLGFLVRDIAAARRGGTAAPTTATSLAGQMGVVSTALAPRGSVRAAGEDWTAVSDSGEAIAEGEEVIVVDMDGLTLKVFPAEDSPGPRGYAANEDHEPEDPDA